MDVPAVIRAEKIVNKHVVREDMIRLPFSFFAAATLLYMAAEYADYTIVGKKHAAPISALCLGLALMEAHKVGVRVERILRLRE